MLERAEAAADGVLRKDEIARLRAELGIDKLPDNSSGLTAKDGMAQARYARRKVMSALTPSATSRAGTDIPKAPALAMAERIEKGLFTTFDTDKDPAERFLGALDAFGPLAGLPVNQTNKMTKALLGIGKTDKVNDPVDFVEAWFYGRRTGRGWNPISRGEKR